MARTWGELLGQGAADETPDEQAGFFGRLRDSLTRSRRALTQQFEGFDPSAEDAWEQLEEALIGADVGVPATAELVRRLEERGGIERGQQIPERGLASREADVAQEVEQRPGTDQAKGHPDGGVERVLVHAGWRILGE